MNLEFYIFLHLIGIGISQIEVQIDVTPLIEVNQNDLVITCRVEGTSTNIINYVISKRVDNIVGFQEVVREEIFFVAAGSLLNTSWSDTDVESRAYLSGVNLPSPIATLVLTIPKENISCDSDSAEYVCEGNSIPAPSTARSEEKEIVVLVQPEPPVRISSSSAEHTAGSPFSFTCNGILRLQSGQLRWWIYRMGSPNPTELTENITSSSFEESRCAYNFSSTLIYIPSREDHGAVVRCTVDDIHFTSSTGRPEDNPNINSEPLSVLYGVRAPTITQQPNMRTYESGNELTLTCTADGNPNPNDTNSFDWFIRPIDGGNEDMAGLRSGVQTNGGRLSIRNLVVAHTGMFICVASNVINNVTYSERIEVEIIIVERASTSIGALVGTYFGGLGTGILFAIAFTLLNKKLGILSRMSQICNKRSRSQVNADGEVVNNNTANKHDGQMTFEDGAIENGTPPTRNIIDKK